MLVCTEQHLSLPLPDGRLAALPAGVDGPPDQERDSDPGSGGREYGDPVESTEALEGECDEEGDHAEVKSDRLEMNRRVDVDVPPHEQGVRKTVDDCKRLEPKHRVFARPQERVLTCHISD